MSAFTSAAGVLMEGRLDSGFETGNIACDQACDFQKLFLWRYDGLTWGQATKSQTRRTRLDQA
jgi:hypothetical protein